MVGSIVIWALSTFPQSDEIDTQIALEKQAVQKSMSGEVLSSELSKLENKRLSLQQENSLLARFGKSLEPVLSLAGFDWRDGVALTTGFVAKEVVISTLGILYGVGEEVDEESTNLAENIKASGKSSLWALAFMVFVLVYSPCISTIAAIRRETSNKWMWFQIIYSLSIAFILAVSIWQVGSLLGY